MASPPQMPYDPRYYRHRRPRSMAGPIILIAVGVMFIGFAASGVSDGWSIGMAFMIAMMAGPVSGYLAVRPKRN